MNENDFMRFNEKLIESLGKNCFEFSYIDRCKNITKFICDPAISRKHFEPHIRNIL